MSRRSFLLAAAGFTQSTGGLGAPPTTAFYGDNTVKLEINEAIDFRSDYTMSGWFWLDDNAGVAHEYILFNIRSPTAGNIDDFEVINDPPVPQLFCQRNGGTDINASAVNPITLNAWHHFALVRSGDTNTLYVDQTAVASGTEARLAGDAAPTIMRLGSWNGDLGYMYGGTFDLKFWTAALTVTELQAEAAQILPARAGNHWGTFVLSSSNDLGEKNSLRQSWVSTGTGVSTIGAPSLPWTV